MFTQEGTFRCTITAARMAEPKFATPPAFDIAITVKTEDGQSDTWRGEVSQSYGRGNAANKTQLELTMGTLAKLGWQHGYQFDRIGELVGTETACTVAAEVSKKDGKTYFNLKYIGEFDGGVQEISPADFASRWAELTGAPAPAAPAQEYAVPAPAPAPAPAAAAKPNPFARR